MGAILWFGKMFAKLALLFAKFDALGLFDALAMLFGAFEEEEVSPENTQVNE